ncbi:putative Neprilysin [Hypsibius exemplaris]|uniref:Neprilysin n=1 Tax=Hypsibius exemplaris TaxID=2072580 RepID=A0A9X6NGP6_HYPEX|nr:putative Neprilysin [Hypsibius exemplaris]
MPEQSSFQVDDGGKKKSLDKWLLGGLALIIAALLITTIALAVLYGQEVQKDHNTTPQIADGTTPQPVPVTTPECSSAACAEAAERLKKAMNTNVNPCDDFYEFACGRFNETEPIPEDRGRWGVFDILRRELSTTLHALLDVPQPDGTALNATEKMQKHFHSCLNETALNDQSNLELLRNHITEIFPEFATFPWTDPASIPTIGQSLAAVSQARRYGSSMGLFSNAIASDHESPRQNIIGFYAASLGLERSLYFNSTDPRYVAYQKYITDMFQLFALRVAPAPLPEGAASTFAAQVIAQEKILAEAALSPEEIRANVSIQYNKMSLRQFATTYTSKIGWDTQQLVEYFSGAWQNPDINAVLNESTVVNVAQTRYWNVMTSSLAAFESSDITATANNRRLFANYMVWQILRGYVGRLGDEFRNISRTFSAVLSGATTPPPRWESCVNSVTNEFPEAVGRLYVERNFHKDTKQKLQTMVDYIFDAFKTMVVGSHWMSHVTRIRALEKAENFAVLIGYDDYIVDDSEKLNQEHQELVISSSYLNNGNIANRSGNQKFEGAPNCSRHLATSSITGPPVVNAFNAPLSIQSPFPAAISRSHPSSAVGVSSDSGTLAPSEWSYGA